MLKWYDNPLSALHMNVGKCLERETAFSILSVPFYSVHFGAFGSTVLYSGTMCNPWCPELTVWTTNQAN